MGTIYFLHAPISCMIKIGYTDQLKKRINKLGLYSPEPLTLIRTIRGKPGVEATLLALFQEFRTHGEWFVARESLHAFIRKLEEGRTYSPHELISFEPS